MVSKYAKLGSLGKLSGGHCRQVISSISGSNHCRFHGHLDQTLAVSRGRHFEFAPLRACPSYLSKHSHTPSTHISNTSFVEKRLLLLYLWCNQLCIVASHTFANLLDLPSPRSDDSTDDADNNHCLGKPTTFTCD